MKVALDTNAYVDFCRGVPSVVSILQSAHLIYLPYIVLGELRAGFLSGTKAKENDRILTRFLHGSRVRELYPDEQTVHHYARLYTQLRDQGTPIPTNDLWIASIALQHNLVLITRDAHFDVIPQLAR